MNLFTKILGYIKKAFSLAWSVAVKFVTVLLKIYILCGSSPVASALLVMSALAFWGGVAWIVLF